MVDIEGKLEWFGKELSERMEDEKLSPSLLAYYSRLTPEKLYNYRQGKAFPKLWNLALLASYLGITVNELLDYDEPDDDSLVQYDPFDIFEDEYEFAMHVHNRVSYAMSDAKLDIFELAERTGFTRATIRKWFGFNDKSPELPRTADFLEICDALDCTPSDILGY